MAPALDLAAELIAAARALAPAPDREMRLELSRFARKTERLQRRIGGFGERRERGALEAGPNNPGPPYTRKHAQTSTRNRKARERCDGGRDGLSDRLDLALVDLAQELEREVQALALDPAHVAQRRGELGLRPAEPVGDFGSDRNGDEEARHGYNNAVLSQLSADCAAPLMTRSRSPENLNSRASLPSRRARPIHTVPTGFASLPPPGPATPVVLRAMSALLARSAPSAISMAVSRLTAPRSS